MKCHAQILGRSILSSTPISQPCFSPPSVRLPRCPQKTHSGLFARLSSTKPQARVEYNWIRGVETLEEYQPGGYNPVMIGDVLHSRYRIVDKLGHGGYSTVWLARDTTVKRYVALKVNTADAHPREATVLRTLPKPPSSSPAHRRCLIPVVFDEFDVQGPNGTYACYITAPAHCNLREISSSRLFPLEVARALRYGLTQAVAYTHSHGYLHGDIHLNNIMIKLPSNFDNLSIIELYERCGEPETVPITRCDGRPLPPNIPAQAVNFLFLGKYAETMTLADVRPLLSDFGEAFAPASEVRLGQDCHTPPAFRSPEARFEPQKPLAYVIGMEALFSIEMVPNDEIVAQHIDVLGPMPREWWLHWEGRGKFFTEDGHPKDAYVENKWPPLEESFDIDIQKWRRKWRGVVEEERTAFLDLIRRMLLFQPEARHVLQSEWMVKWALPDFERNPNISG
ncbi:kinase-like protein [Aspergillus neoniger CBS 115656]|uniref:non-specific serine/threonine protein kinase n=1 Tax=Aspergillus neoniger (strain CBS 115656) TaxID=1448310 RepID=A0A318Y5Y0_ASPNB|nr:kinase-like protein [Aspergillus neoniger CBS 115656]PYH29279.1 kinase-like protein [Aspergillus neoniger CBS 115656]